MNRSISFSAIRVNNIITQDILSQRTFHTNVTSVKWFPSVVSQWKLVIECFRSVLS